MAAARALADHNIVTLILGHLSTMKEQHRVQGGPDQPVELAEYPPTLVPCMQVNRMWRDHGALIVWQVYPHLPALKQMDTAQRQWYADRVEQVNVQEPAEGEDLAYLAGLKWPNLKHARLAVDFKKHSESIATMLHANLEQLELSGIQTSSSAQISNQILPSLFVHTKKLRSIAIGPEFVDHLDPIASQVLRDILDSLPSVIDVRITNANFTGKDALFERLSQRPGLEALEIDLDPGVQMIPFLSTTSSSAVLFASLRHLHIVCYPEVALALPAQLQSLEELHLNIARRPDQSWQESDLSIMDDALVTASQYSKLKVLRISVGQLANDFPTARSFPTLFGSSLVKLAIGCPHLEDLDLLVSSPAAIDGSNISSSQFESFCRRLPSLRMLSLKLHPQTAVQLELSALPSLGTYCLHLEELCLMIAVHLPSLTALSVDPPVPVEGDALPSPDLDNCSIASTPSIAINGRQRGSSLDSEYFPSIAAPTQPLFPHLTYLAFARPQTILSITSNSYTLSSSSFSSTAEDDIVEQNLVAQWAHPLETHFPAIVELQAWNDWTGEDKDSLTYVFPLEDVLATTHSFLSGVEQDIWDDGSDLNNAEDDDWANTAAPSFRFMNEDDYDNGDDWDKASELNEYASDDSIITPGRTMAREDGEEFFRLQ